MSKQVIARARFLDQTAHLLALTSPSTAAFLQSRVDQLAAGNFALDPSGPKVHIENILPLSNERHLDVCSSCGYDLTSLPLKYEPPARRGSVTKQKRASSSSTRRLVVECHGCGVKTHQDITRPKLDRRGAKSPAKEDVRISSEKNIKTPTAVASEPRLTTTSNRKRAKSRKGGSLSAMLAKSKADAESSRSGFGGFDLMDLMKTT